MIRILCLALEGPLELSGVECLSASNWQEARALLQGPLDAVVCGLWVPCGPDSIDARQVLTYLRTHRLLPGYVVLSPHQAHLAQPLQGVAEAVVVETRHGGRLPLYARLRQDFGLPDESQACNEIVWAHEGQSRYHFQSLQAELRADLLTFLELKGQSFEKATGLGPGRSCQLVGQEFKARVRFLGQNGVLWTALHPAGPAYPDRAGDVQQEALRACGVRL